MGSKSKDDLNTTFTNPQNILKCGQCGWEGKLSQAKEKQNKLICPDCSKLLIKFKKKEK